MVTVVAGWCPEDKSADEAPVNKLDVAEDTFKDSSAQNVLENELGGDKSASISEDYSRKE